MAGASSTWPAPPDICGMDDGLPIIMDKSRRLMALGNAVVPQVAEVIGYQLLRSIVKNAPK